MALPLILILALVPGVLSPAQTIAPVIWAGAKSGPHSIGAARIAIPGLDVTYWYPAASGGRPARLRDFSTRSAALLEVMIGGGLADSSARAYVESIMAARWEAPRAPGSFPMILIGQGNHHDALNQAVLAEIIASHGFVVVTVPSPTVTSSMKSADDVGPFAQRQAEDLLAAATRVAALSGGDLSRMAVVGHSFGARAALLIAMHDARVKALVSLDGGIGTATAQDSFARASWFARARGAAPILHFYETGDPAMVPDFTLLRSLPVRDLTLRELKGLEHAHFTTLGFQAAVEPLMRRITGMEPDGPRSLLAMTDELISLLKVHLQ